MKKLDRYLIKAFIGPFLAILLIVVFILLLQFLWLYIDELVGKGLSLKVVMEFLGWGATTMLPLSLPLATVLASMMTMGSLAEHSELVALKSAGISLGRVITPLIICSFLLSVGAFFIANNLVPTAYNNIYTLRDDISKTKDEIKIPSKTFYDGIDGYILRVERNDKETGMMHGVMVYNHTSGRGNVSLAIADSAMLKMSDDKTFLTFALYNGINYEESNSRSYRDTTLQLQRTEFSSQELIIPLEHYEFQKTETGRYSDQAKSMRLSDLQEDQDSIRISLVEQRKHQVDELRRDVALLYNSQMDSAKADNFRSDFDFSVLPKLSLREDIDAHNRAISRMNGLVSTLTTFDRETAYPAFSLKLIDLEIYKKFALAFACFIMFFIGAPLGALIRKGGLGTPAIVSVLFFVLYYIVDIVGTKLAKDGAIDSFSGSFIAAYVLFPLGAFMTYKAIKDEPVFGSEKMVALYSKIKRFIMERIHKTNIVYMGTPEFAVAPLKALIDNGYNVVAVVTVPDKPSGRGQMMNESAVKKFAVSQGIPVLQPVKMKDPEFLSQLQSFKPDMIVVVAFRLLPREVWSMPRLGTFNLHAALLPQYRGAAPINWAVINGERITGVTSFLIDDGIDTGTILMREQYRIKPEDTAADVHDALMEMGTKVVLQTVGNLLEGNAEARLQKSFIQGAEVLRKAPKLSKELCHIDWSDSAVHIVNLIRGLSDYPAAYTELTDADGKVTALKIFKATVDSGNAGNAAAGSITSDGKTFLGISAGDGKTVLLQSVQLAGKKRMDIEDFLRGFHNPCAYTLSKGTSRAIIEELRRSEQEA